MLSNPLCICKRRRPTRSDNGSLQSRSLPEQRYWFSESGVCLSEHVPLDHISENVAGTTERTTNGCPGVSGAVARSHNPARWPACRSTRNSRCFRGWSHLMALLGDCCNELALDSLELFPKAQVAGSTPAGGTGQFPKNALFCRFPLRSRAFLGLRNPHFRPVPLSPASFFPLPRAATRRMPELKSLVSSGMNIGTLGENDFPPQIKAKSC